MLIPQLKLCSYLHGILTHFFLPLTLPLSQDSHLELHSSVTTKYVLTSTRDSACKTFPSKPPSHVFQCPRDTMCHRGREKKRPSTEPFPGSTRDGFSVFFFLVPLSRNIPADGIMCAPFVLNNTSCWNIQKSLNHLVVEHQQPAPNQISPIILSRL